MNFDLTFSFMLPILKWFADQTHSWGWAIIGLTVLVRILVAPLVQSSTLQMRKMSQLQPQMAKLQAKYKEDPEQLQKNMMEFYKKNKMNPMGGCLPMLVQLPILFALYGAFSGPPFVEKAIDVPIKIVATAQGATLKSDIVSKNTVPYVAPDGDLSKIAVYPGETCIVQGTTLDFGTRPVQGTLKGDLSVKWKLIPKGDKDPSKLPEFSGTHFSVASVTPPGEYQLQANVPAIASTEPFGFITSLGKVSKGLQLIDPKNWDVLFLILAFGVTTYLSSLFSTGGSPSTPDGEMTEQQLIQKQTMKMMPVTMTVMFCFIPLPAGVFLYFVVSNLFQVIQTWWLTKQPTPAIIGLDDDEPGDSSGGSGGSGVKRSGGGPKEGPSGRSKGPSGGKSTDPSGGSPATISSNSGPKAGIAATTTSGSTLDISDPDKRKAKKKKK